MEGNALRMNWQDIIAKEKLNYIMGNPPFIGARLMNKDQKEDVNNIFDGWKGIGNLDYVSCWYKKSADFMYNTFIKTALVSTNSITQGEAVHTLWKPLFDSGIQFDFAYRTFIWDSEASTKAHVNCVIIGFSRDRSKHLKKLYSNDNRVQMVENINAYLLNAPNIFINSRKKSLSNMPEMMFGSMPNDGGFLSNYSEEDKNKIIRKYSNTEKLFKQFVGATEFINNKKRYCLWLKDISPQEYRNILPMKLVIENVQKLRSESSRKATRELASTPYLFGEIRQPESNYLIIPAHSSENRRYIPVGYMDKDVICSNANLIIPNASLYMFGILSSNVHMAWIRAICGRIKNDYRYSINIVYNNFPWCNPTIKQKQQIEKTAQMILDARNLYPNASLADLYDELTMSKELRKAHQENDKAVMEVYGFDWRNMNEANV